jgi:CheY-like chemotaxis protein
MSAETSADTPPAAIPHPTPVDPASRALEPGGAYKILVVEDEVIVALDLMAILGEMGHAVTGHAVSADEALGLVAEVRPDLVLMDIRIRGVIDGIEAARQIQSHYGLIPFIFLTAFADEHTIQRARAVERANFLQKPFAKHLLEEAVTGALNLRPTNL